MTNTTVNRINPCNLFQHKVITLVAVIRTCLPCPLLIFWPWTDAAALTAKLNLEQLQQHIPEDRRHQTASSVPGHISVYVRQAACFPSILTMAPFILVMDQVQEPQFSNLFWADQ